MVLMMNNALDTISGALTDLQNAIDDGTGVAEALTNLNTAITAADGAFEDEGQDALDAFATAAAALTPASPLDAVEALAHEFSRTFDENRDEAARDAAIEAAIDARRNGDR